MSKVDDMVNDAMLTMLTEFGVLAYLVSRIGVTVIDDDQQNAIAYPNGKSIYINRLVIDKMNEQGTDTDNEGHTYDITINKDKLIFVIAHEVMHILNNTNDRGELLSILLDDTSQENLAKHKLWNIATDFEINSLLKNNKTSNNNGNDTAKPIGEMPGFGCYDDKYIGIPAEKIYEELYNQAKQNNYSSVSAGGMTYKLDDDNAGNQNDGDSSDGNDQGQGSSNGNNNNNGKQPNGLTYGLDKHMPYADKMTEAEVAAKVNDVLTNMANNGNGIGTGMSAFDRALEIFFKPQPFNWRRALTKYIKSFMKDNYTWNKPSRAGIANGLILPSPHVTPKLHVAIAVDTSGSIGNTELELLLNHVFTILTQFKQFQVDVWCCSTHVHEDTFTTYTAANKNKLNEFKIASDGGTDMSANLPFIEKKYAGKMPDVVMVFTDGIDNLSGDTTTRTKFPIVWLITDNKNFKKPSLIPGAVYEFNTEV